MVPIVLIIALIVVESYGRIILTNLGVLAASEYLSYYELYRLKQAANSGDTKAMWKLSLYYGIWKNDMACQLMWYKTGAEAGDPLLQLAYGKKLYWSEGKKKEGVQWITRSAETGYKPAIEFAEKYIPASEITD